MVKIWLIRRYKNLSKPYYSRDEAVNEMNTNVYMENHPDIELIEVKLDLDKIKNVAN